MLSCAFGVPNTKISKGIFCVIAELNTIHYMRHLVQEVNKHHPCQKWQGMPLYSPNIPLCGKHMGTLSWKYLTHKLQSSHEKIKLILCGTIVIRLDKAKQVYRQSSLVIRRGHVPETRVNETFAMTSEKKE